MANEYGRWYVRNDPQSWQKDIPGYDRSFDAQFRRPPEYTPSVEEYRQYPAMQQYLEEQERKKNQKQDTSQQAKSQQQRLKQGKARRVSQNVVKNLAGKAVAVVAGGAVIVVGYQAISAEMAAQAEPAIVEYAQADWTGWTEIDDTITIKLYDEQNNVIKELVATIGAPVVVDATCTQAGSKTYTATAEEDGTAYTDTHTLPIDALDHDYGEWTFDTDDDGNDVMVRECLRCHEHFTATIEQEEM